LQLSPFVAIDVGNAPRLLIHADEGNEVQKHVITFVSRDLTVVHWAKKVMQPGSLSVSRPDSARHGLSPEQKASDGTTQNNILAAQEQKLMQIFATPSLMKEFRVYAEKGCITENLDFLLDLEQFRGTITRLAKGMQEIYFLPNCEKPLNITNKVVFGWIAFCTCLFCCFIHCL
jgi:hypothetical protein